MDGKRQNKTKIDINGQKWTERTEFDNNREKLTETVINGQKQTEVCIIEMKLTETDKIGQT